MGKKILWLAVSSLMVLSLVMAACGPAASTSVPTTPTAPTASTAPTTQTALTTPTIVIGVVKAQTGGVAPETPKYGGVLVGIGSDPNGFDPGLHNSVLTSTIYYTFDKLLQADWGKGPAGTGQTTWLNYLGVDSSLQTGDVAESYEIPDDTTIIFHIRKGIHFWNKPPVNGREVTADDVVYSLQREWNAPLGYARLTWPAAAAPTSIKALDKNTVEFKFPSGYLGLHIISTASLTYIVPHEVVEKYGNFDVDWTTIVATGPFMLTDYVRGSSLTFTKNQNYFMVDPNHPENKIPYIDAFRQLIIPDTSTRLAAFRTGKVDFTSLSHDDFTQMIKQRPMLDYVKTLGAMTSLKGYVDKAHNLPFQDLRVREAMNLAVDRQAILNTLYQGDGILMGWPWYPIKEHANAYVPLNQLPQAAQDMFSYDPVKAKQLLADAGYPSGFNTQVAATSTQVDTLAVLKDYLSKVNIDLTINVLDSGPYNVMLRAKTFPEMVFGGSKMYFLPWVMHEVRAESFDDVSNFDSPETRAAYNQVQSYLGKDDAKVWQTLKDITPFMIEQDPVGIYMPVPYGYNVWWPWLQNWFGATSMGYWEPTTNVKYAWIDQDLKKAMGY